MQMKHLNTSARLSTVCGFLSLSSLLTSSVLAELEPLGPGTGGEQDLCQLLRRVSSLHALRAPDPSLMLRYEEVTCPADVENERCQIRKQRSFARRKTLATMVLDREQRGET